ARISAAVTTYMENPPCHEAARGARQSRGGLTRRNGHGVGDRVLLLVRQADVHRGDALLLGPARGAPVERHHGAPRRRAADSPLAPAHGPPAAAQRLHDRRFGRKAGGEMSRPPLFRSAVHLLAGGEDAPEKRGLMPRQRPRHPLHRHNVHADAGDHRQASSASMSLAIRLTTACSRSASVLSPMTRMSGSVPDGRTKSRPESPSSARASAMAFWIVSFPAKAALSRTRTLTKSCGTGSKSAASADKGLPSSRTTRSTWSADSTPSPVVL